MKKVLEMCEGLDIVKTPKTDVVVLSKSVKSDLLRLYVKKDREGFLKKLKEAPDVVLYDVSLQTPLRDATKDARVFYLEALKEVEKESMVTGAIISQYLFKAIFSHELTPKQKGQLTNLKQGTWNPEGIDLDETLKAIMVMDIRRETTDLIYLLKEVTPMPKARGIIFYLDGEECSKTTFMDMEHILGIRSIGGAEAHSEDTNTMWMSTGDRPDSDFAKGGLGEKNSIMKNSTSGSGRQGGFHSSDHEKM